MIPRKYELLAYIPDDLMDLAKTIPALQLKHIVYDTYGKIRDESDIIKKLGEYFKK